MPKLVLKLSYFCRHLYFCLELPHRQLLSLFSERSTRTTGQSRVGTGLREGKEAKLWAIFVHCSLAHNFLQNQKVLGKHKHGWVMLSLLGLELEQTFSLSFPLPACELDPSFLFINNNRVKCLLVSWKKSLPWCTGSNLATISSEEKYWRGVALFKRWGERGIKVRFTEDEG